MNNPETIMQDIENVESTDSSFCKIGDSADTLVISFAHIMHGGFASKSSLVNKKCENNNFDILYMRDVEKKWYLSGLPAIGNSFSDTLKFLKSEVSKYKNTIYIGSSMGGYASILFASLLKGSFAVAQMPQTDLDYIMKDSSDRGAVARSLFKRVKEHDLEAWNLYKNLNSIMNTSTQYIVGGFDHGSNILHDLHHRDNIKSYSNVVFPSNFNFLKEVKAQL